MKELNEYENKLYDFLVKEENFKNMSLVVEQFEMVRKQLIYSFWNEVIERSKAKLLEGNDSLKWQCEFNQEGLKSGYFKPYFYLPEWKNAKGEQDICVSWDNNAAEGWWYGIMLNYHQPYQGIIRKELTRLPRDWAKGITVKPNDAWWPYFKIMGLDLNNHNDLKRILPIIRDGLIEEYANITMEFCLAVQFDITTALRTQRQISATEANLTSI